MKEPKNKLLLLRDLIVLLTLGLVPVVFLPVNIDRLDFIRPAILFINTSICFLIEIFLIFKGKSFILPSKKFIKIIFIFIFFYFISTILSIHKLTSLWGIWGLFTDGLIYQFSLIVLFFLLFQYFAQKESIKKAIEVLLFSSVFASFLAIYQHFFYHWPRPKGMFEGPNFLAYFLGSLIPLNFFILKEEKNYLKKIFYFLLLSLVIFVFFLTLSRNAWILFFVSIIIIAFLRMGVKDIRTQIKNFSSLKNFSFVFFIFLPTFILLRKPIFSRILSASQDYKNQVGSSQIRLKEIQAAVKLFFYPRPFYQYLFGTGPATVTYTFLKVRPISSKYLPLREQQRVVMIRNQYLQFLNSNGLIGLTTFFSILVFVFFACLKSKKRKIINYLFISWFFLVVSYFFSSQTVESGLIFWTLSAVALSKKDKKLVNILKPINLIVISSITFFSVAILLFTCLSLASEFFASKGNFLRAIKLNQYNDYYWRRYTMQIHKIARKEKSLDYFEKGRDAALRLYKLNPADPTNLDIYSLILYQEAVIFKKREFLPKALELSLKWLEMDPSNPLAYDAVGLAYLELGEPSTALPFFVDSIKINENFALGYAHAGEAYKQLGQLEATIDYYQKALEKRPSWSVAQQELNKAKDLKAKESLDKSN